MGLRLPCVSYTHLDVYKRQGLYIPLIVVNCIVLGRAEAFASKNGPLTSLCDGIGNGLGFTLALCFIGLIRCLLYTS